MTVTRYREGTTTVTLTGDMEAFARRVAIEASKGAITAVEEALEPVAARAQAVWYTEVERQTGLSGQIAVITTIDASRDVATVAVGSTDQRKDKRGRPAVAFIHRPRALSTVVREISEGEYNRVKSLGGIAAKTVFHAGPNAVARDPKLKLNAYYREIGNPLASDGKYLLQIHVRAPGRVAIRGAVSQIAARISRAVNRGG